MLIKATYIIPKTTRTGFYGSGALISWYIVMPVSVTVIVHAVTQMIVETANKFSIFTN
jgi:hypothetical protein